MSHVLYTSFRGVSAVLARIVIVGMKSPIHGVNFQKRQLIQVSFWLVKHVLQTNRFPFQTGGNCVSLKGVLHFSSRNGAIFKHKGQLSFFERNVASLKDTLHILTHHCFCCLS